MAVRVEIEDLQVANKRTLSNFCCCLSSHPGYGHGEFERFLNEMQALLPSRSAIFAEISLGRLFFMRLV